MKTFKPLLTLIVSSLISTAALASDSVAPAMSEDISAFDANVAKARKAAPAQKPANFGSAVSKKAQELHGTPPQGYKNFGQWVSDQRRSQGNSSSSNAGGNGNANGKPESPGHGGNPNKKVK
jgi:hypothetical protein